MKIREILEEARSHAELNPKISVNQQIVDKLASTTDTIAGVKNLFVSFTRIEKLGINPSSTFKGTPLGIYAYPAEYVVKRAGLTKQLKSPTLPFAGNFPYANLFSTRGRVINLAKLTDTEFDRFLPKLESVLVKYCKLKKSQAAQAVDDLVSHAEFEGEQSEYAGGRLWNITKELADQFLSKALSTSQEIAWNKLFRLLGITGVVDSGLGIIEPREKTQAVFFSIDSIDNVSRVENKYSPDYINQQITKHQSPEHSDEII